MEWVSDLFSSTGCPCCTNAASTPLSSGCAVSSFCSQERPFKIKRWRNGSRSAFFCLDDSNKLDKQMGDPLPCLTVCPFERQETQTCQYILLSSVGLFLRRTTLPSRTSCTFPPSKETVCFKTRRMRRCQRNADRLHVPHPILSPKARILWKRTPKLAVAQNKLCHFRREQGRMKNCSCAPTLFWHTKDTHQVELRSYH